MKDETLYVVVPYFNHTNAAINRTNLELCLRNLSIYKHSRVILVEGIWNKEAELQDFSDSVYKHLKFDLQSPIWVKENLINLGIQSLNNDWEYVCWLDKDIHFLNPNWDIDTINKLKEYDIIQPWSRVLFLNKNYEIDRNIKSNNENSFVTMFNNCSDPEKEKGFLSYGKTKELGYVSRVGHPGHTWATNRKFYEKIGGLFDRCIVGGGDSFLLCVIDQEFDLPYLKLKEHYKSFYAQYINLARGTKVGCIEGTIAHYFHGDMENRNYFNRYKLLSDKINIENDIEYQENGTLKINNKEKEKDILDYFYSRKEHEV
jgi:hypothetical protein